MFFPSSLLLLASYLGIGLAVGTRRARTGGWVERTGTHGWRGVAAGHARAERGNPRNPLIRENLRFRHGGAVGGSYLSPLVSYLGIGLAVGRLGTHTAGWGRDGHARAAVRRGEAARAAVRRGGDRENHLTAREGLEIIYFCSASRSNNATSGGDPWLNTIQFPSS